MSKNKTVAIIYGWAEGPWESRLFREELRKKGLRPVKDLYQADIIIGHSSGCYLVPNKLSNKTIFLVGLPYWPTRSLFYGGVQKLWLEFMFHRSKKNLGWWSNKLFHNAGYILSRPMASYNVLTKHSADNLPSNENNNVTIVRPTYDTFCHPKVMEFLPKPLKYSFVEIRGAHDDCWINPKPYIELLL